MIGSAEFAKYGLFDLAAPLTTVQRAAYQAMWQQLRAENAPLRAIVDEKPISVPIGHFDPLILSRVTTQWQKALHVVGHAIAHDAFDEDVFQQSDIFLSARLGALIATGVIEASSVPSGALGRWLRQTEVRLPSGPVQPAAIAI